MSASNYRLKIQFDGTKYHGWEHQPKYETIQGKLENVLARMCDIPTQEIDLIGAGRTDAGVHAKEMIASVKLDTEYTPEEIRDYLNAYLPDDIAVFSVEEAGYRFHARYNAVGKTYQYTLFDGPARPVFNRKYYAVSKEPLDIEKMQKAAGFFVGEHDFRSFCGNSHMKKSTVRRIDSLEVRRAKGYIYITVEGNGFLQNMVRIIAGTLIEVGLGRMEPEKIPEIIKGKDRLLAGPTAPAKGLCLLKVHY